MFKLHLILVCITYIAILGRIALFTFQCFVDIVCENLTIIFLHIGVNIAAWV